MEFFDYKRACKELKAIGIVPDADGEAVRFTLQKVPQVVPDVHAIVFGDASLAEDAPDGAASASVEKDRIPQLAEDLVHTLHLDEVLLVPVRKWGAVVNLVAFDLAEDESWLSIDAEAAVHQNSHDPLQLGPPDLSLVTAMCTALMTHGESDEADLTIVATGAPLTLEFRHAGALIVRCGHAGMRDTLLGVVEG
ncbi:MAG: hypothetical protein ACF8QF_05265 [Phycisphaerales bacterium]